MEPFNDIRSYLKLDNKKLSGLHLNITDHECIMTWMLNKLCNYRCIYCFLSDEFLSNEHPETGKHSHEYIAGCFDRTGKSWMIILSGGEPFLYPDFTGLVSTLTRHHYIVINTNLSMKSTYDFGEKINPERVIVINASMHMTELSKRRDGLNQYIEKFLYLQEKGFNIYLSYVAYPPLVASIEKDVAFFRSKGVNQLCLKYFHGMYNGRPYPQAYSREERDIISRNALDPFETDYYQDKPFFYGSPCRAGQKFFAMDMAGNLKRCSTVTEEYGNFFHGNFTFDKASRPCPARECLCPYEGFLLAHQPLHHP